MLFKVVNVSSILVSFFSQSIISFPQYLRYFNPPIPCQSLRYHLHQRPVDMNVMIHTSNIINRFGVVTFNHYFSPSFTPTRVKTFQNPLKLRVLHIARSTIHDKTANPTTIYVSFHPSSSRHAR